MSQSAMLDPYSSLPSPVTATILPPSNHLPSRKDPHTGPSTTPSSKVIRTTPSTLQPASQSRRTTPHSRAPLPSPSSSTENLVDLVLKSIRISRSLEKKLDALQAIVPTVDELRSEVLELKRGQQRLEAGYREVLDGQDTVIDRQKQLANAISAHGRILVSLQTASQPYLHAEAEHSELSSLADLDDEAELDDLVSNASMDRLSVKSGADQSRTPFDTTGGDQPIHQHNQTHMDLEERNDVAVFESALDGIEREGPYSPGEGTAEEKEDNAEEEEEEGPTRDKNPKRLSTKSSSTRSRPNPKRRRVADPDSSDGDSEKK